MGTYKADNGKIVDTSKMEGVLDLDYDGCYGTVRCDLNRTRRSKMRRLFYELRRTLRAMRSGQYSGMRGGIDFHSLVWGLWKEGEFAALLSKVMRTL